MANEERLRVIIDALNLAKDELGQLEGDLKGVDEKAKEAGGGVGKLNDGLAGAIENATGFSLASVSAAGAIGLVGTAIAATISKTADYAAQVDTLSSKLNVNAAEASRLIEVADDARIDMGTLEVAAKTLAKDGLQLNIDTLADLADQYNALEDPVEKQTFLMERFGDRAGPELARLLRQGSDAIREQGAMMDEKGVASAERYRLAIDDLQDSWNKIVYTAGPPLMDFLSDAMGGFDNFSKVVGILNVQTAHMLGLTDDATYRLQAEAVAAGNTFAVFDSSLNPATQEAARLQQAGAEAIDRYGLGLRDYVNDAIAAKGATDTLSAGFDYTLTATDKLTIGLKSYNAQLLFSIASADMDAAAALNLGVAMGVVDTRSLVAAEGVAALKDKYDINADGAISAAEATAGYSAAVAALSSAISSIPEQKKVRIEIESYGGNLPQVTAGTGVVAVPRASGGAFSSGDALLFNEHPATRPEVIIANQSGGGYVLTQQQAQAALGGGRGGITINGLTINANTYAGGQAAAAGFADEMALRALAGAL